MNMYELCWERGEQVSTMIIKAKSEEQARKWFNENRPGKTIVGISDNYGFKPGEPVIVVPEVVPEEEVKKITEIFTPEAIELAKDFGEQQAFEEVPRTIYFFNEGQDCVTPFRDETLREDFTLPEAVEYYGFKKVYEFIENVQRFFLSERESTGNTMNLTTEAIIKQIKQSLIDGNGFDVWDDGEGGVWNYMLEVFDGIAVRLVVWQNEFLDGDKEPYTRTNYITMTTKEFLKTPWRELEKKINEACFYAY